jgi:hypothetical protein
MLGGNLERQVTLAFNETRPWLTTRSTRWYRDQLRPRSLQSAERDVSRVSGSLTPTCPTHPLVHLTCSFRVGARGLGPSPQPCESLLGHFPGLAKHKTYLLGRYCCCPLFTAIYWCFALDRSKRARRTTPPPSPSEERNALTRTFRVVSGSNNSNPIIAGTVIDRG